MIKSLMLLYLVIVTVLLIIVLAKSNFLKLLDQKLYAKLFSNPEITQYFRDIVSYHLRMDDNTPDGAVFFIGDSLIQGLCVAAITPNAINYGIGGDTTTGVLQRIRQYHALKRARAIVIAIGANDFHYRQNAAILRNYAEIEAGLPPNIPLIFSAVMPVNETLLNFEPHLNNRIRALNAGLKAQLMLTHRSRFLDAGALLLDKEGKLADAYHIGDGEHLNTNGNAIWIKALQQALLEVQQHNAS